MSMDLRNWLRNGWLVEQEATAEGIAALLALADRDIQAAQVTDLDEDWRFNIAYNGALQAAITALAAAGYRVARGSFP